MRDRHGVPAILVALSLVAGGCNAILGVSSHPLAADGGTSGSAGASGGAGTGGGSGGAAGTAGTSGESYESCGVDGSAVDGSAAEDAGTGVTCGFPMPNPESSDPLLLPNQAKYKPNTA